MIKNLFDIITRGSIRFRWVTITLSVLLMAAGILALTQLNQELIPPVEFPQSVVLAFNQGATPEEMLEQVTIPLEDAIRAVEGAVYVESNTGSGFAAIIISSELGPNQDAIRDEIRTAVGGLDYPEGMETPELIAFSMSDLPLASISVSSSELSLEELKVLVESEVVAELEAVDQVARVAVSGGQELPAAVAQADEPAPTPTQEPTATATPAPTATATALPEPTAAADDESQTEEPEPVPVPASWAQAAAAQGMTLESTADLGPEIVAGIAALAPQMLEDLTPEMLLAMPLEGLAALPDDYVSGLDNETRKAVANRLEQLESITKDDEIADGSPLLPDSWVAMSEGADVPVPIEFGTAADLQDNAFGMGVADLLNLLASSLPNDAPGLVGDLTPELMLWWAERDPEFLVSLAPSTVKLLSPEVIALFPAEVLAELDAAQAEAEAVSVAAPPLPDTWAGPDSPFQTSADLLNNPFGLSAADLLNVTVERNPESIGDLTPDVILWLGEQDASFFDELQAGTLRLFSPETLSALPETFIESLEAGLREELAGIAAGTVEVFVPTETINRTNGRPSLSLTLYKVSEANTVAVTHAAYDKLDELRATHSGLRFDVAFEQASFIEESIEGVSREGGLGALFAILVILLFLSGQVSGRYRLSWRSTLVTSVSIPLSVMMGFALMRWLPPAGNAILTQLVESVGDVAVIGGILNFLLALFPPSITLNIMTLSGMTVAVGRVVDDSIVVLENIYRHIQRGKDPRQAVIDGTRDVAIPIFASTVTTVVVFLPIGLMGGMIGGFFLPFGMTVTYALGSSFIVAITIVPVLAYLFIRKEHLPAEKESSMQRAYTPLLKWALRHRAWTLVVAAVAFAGSLLLMADRPRAFIPDMGEASLNVNVDLPNGTAMAETDGLVRELEAYLSTLDGAGVYQSEIGSAGGMEAAMFASGVSQGTASVTIAVESAEDLELLMPQVRGQAERIFGADHTTVSAGGLTGGAMGSFDLVLAGDPDVLAGIDAEVIAALEAVDGLENVTSNLSAGGAIIRVDGTPAVQYGGELESENTMGVIAAGKAAVEDMEGLPAGVTVSEGFMSDMQTEGFAQASQALVISIVVVYLVMVATFGSLAHPFVILFSLPLAVVGASLGLWITDRVVGISAMVGLMMLVGIVVTNAIILIDRVRINRKDRAMGIYDALIEAGRTRLRPILMTAMAAILALVPLALGLTEGALIASELATVVIGGLMVSTLLTLLVVPVVYSLVESTLRRLRRA
ncbi:MAG: MMPL family transporter [Ardenticatenales bacterium]|nr:MMPL family transporter [Ardenticatenales bacterium]